MTADVQRELAEAEIAGTLAVYTERPWAATKALLAPDGAVQRLIEAEGKRAAAAELRDAADSRWVPRWTIRDLRARAAELDPAGADSRETGR